MLATWTKLLPVFVVEWIASFFCPVRSVDGIHYFEAYKNILIRSEQDFHHKMVDKIMEHIRLKGLGSAKAQYNTKTFKKYLQEAIDLL